MRSKNSKPITALEAAHMAKVKSAPCSVCEGVGGFAHHIKQGDHYTTVALCWDCHQGHNGWHGNKSLWKIKKMDELDALNITMRNLYACGERRGIT